KAAQRAECSPLANPPRSFRAGPPASRKGDAFERPASSERDGWLGARLTGPGPGLAPARHRGLRKRPYAEESNDAAIENADDAVRGRRLFPRRVPHPGSSRGRAGLRAQIPDELPDVPYGVSEAQRLRPGLPPEWISDAEGDRRDGQGEAGEPGSS